jgi:transaldolase/glucose-6-phosphate isomerase
MTPIQQLRASGQSLWLDYIRRDILESGELARLIAADEVHGVTSNPTIFAAAIATGDLYTSGLRPLAQADWMAERIVDALMIDDVRAAADLFLPLYERTNGQDGFVSIEVNPGMAGDTANTLREARRLWTAINRPNVMVKIPATPAGVPAIEQAVAEGININVTLVFSLERYAEVIDAYLRGLETRQSSGASLDHVASVASFFVSRVDAKVDGLLEDLVRHQTEQGGRAMALMGKIAIANAKLAYAQYKAAFGSERFQALARHGARNQRPLWASTSTKNPAYPDTYYVDNLIGPETVNTVPPETLTAFRDHGRAEPTLDLDLSAARAQLDMLSDLGISISSVTDQLEKEGVAKFEASFVSMQEAVAGRARALRQELGDLRPAVQKTLVSLETAGFGRRLWQRDPSLWTERASEAEGIGERLGWLDLPQASAGMVDVWERFASEVRETAMKQVILLAMGGSSLAADVMRRTLASEVGLSLLVLDSTDPATVLEATSRGAPEDTLFIVASKSGTTTEPLALMEHFWAEAGGRLGEGAPSHFAAITDPGTPLEALAKERGFRRVFSSPPEVGGRYSALSAFGLLPGALMGVDIRGLIKGGSRMAHACSPRVETVRNPGLFLGAVLGTAALQGRDKLTFVADPGLEPLEDWIEQLIAESSGKAGKGILPIVGEPPAPARAYGDDRLMVYLRRGGEQDRRVRSWAKSGLPVVVLEVGAGAQGFGAEFFRWEVATATACHLIGVNAFDQPDVQRAKTRTVELLKVYRRRGSLPRPETLWEGDGITLWGGQSRQNPPEPGGAEAVLPWLLTHIRPREALAFLIYLEPTPALERAMARFRRTLHAKKGVPTTLGFGPRYLHSTGQLHKGGPDRMVFLVVTADPKVDLPVPGASHTFGILERAQAVGDLQALLALGRRAYGLHFDRQDRFRELAAKFVSALGASGAQG